MKTFALADIHGNWELAKRALIAAGAVDFDPATGNIKKKPGITLIQLGDIINGTKDSVERDLVALENVPLFDYVIVGNHDFPYWNNDPASSFYGFEWNDEINAAIDKHRWRFKAAKAVGEVLLTHAGLSREYEGVWASAQQAADYIDKIWRTTQADRLFTGIGRTRGGPDKYGGIMWSDWSEAKTRTFSQLFGHTPGNKIRKRLSTTQDTAQYCIDLGGKGGQRVGGAWIEHEYQKPTIVTPFDYDGGVPITDQTGKSHRHIWVKRDKKIGGHECLCGQKRECTHPMCSCTNDMRCVGTDPVQVVA
jgi:hypothetical protein